MHAALTHVMIMMLTFVLVCIALKLFCKIDAALTHTNTHMDLNLPTSTYLVYLVEWLEDVGHLGKVYMVGVIVAVQGNDT